MLVGLLFVCNFPEIPLRDGVSWFCSTLTLWGLTMVWGTALILDKAHGVVQALMGFSVLLTVPSRCLQLLLLCQLVQQVNGCALGPWEGCSAAQTLLQCSWIAHPKPHEPELRVHSKVKPYQRNSWICLILSKATWYYWAQDHYYRECLKAGKSNSSSCNLTRPFSDWARNRIQISRYVFSQSYRHYFSSAYWHAGVDCAKLSRVMCTV